MITERIDDIPLLLATFEKSNLSDYLCQFFPDHGNWLGLAGGKVATVFLAYVLSEGDHRISHLQNWVATRIHLLRHCMNAPNLSSKDFTDDKLESLLDRFSDKEQWDSFEHAHNQNLINIFDLNVKDEAIRLDAMITQSFREPKEDFQYGHAKQHRADLPQLKTMLATVDPLRNMTKKLILAGMNAISLFTLCRMLKV